MAVSSFQMLLAIGYFLYLEQSGLTLFFLFFVAIESKVAFSQTKHLKNAIYLILILKICLKKKQQQKTHLPIHPSGFPKNFLSTLHPKQPGSTPHAIAIGIRARTIPLFRGTLEQRLGERQGLHPKVAASGSNAAHDRRGWGGGEV